MNQWAS